MYNKKLCLGFNPDFCENPEREIELIKETGFECIFLPFNREFTPKLAEKSKAVGLEIQSVHAPFGGCRDLWEGSKEEAESFTEKLIDCVHMCTELNIPLMISHAYIGFDEHKEPNEQGLSYYEKVVKEAEKNGIKIAFENTEGEEFLDYILQNLKIYKNVGFCWDTGHEMCYNFSKDMPGLYKECLFATHLNDNLGIKDINGNITWHDDLHLLPFDGIADWQNIADRLNRSEFSAPLTFELCKKSKPGRHENDIYENMSSEIYLAQAYARACRVATLVTKGTKY